MAEKLAFVVAGGLGVPGETPPTQLPAAVGGGQIPPGSWPRVLRLPAVALVDGGDNVGGILAGRAAPPLTWFLCGRRWVFMK